VRTESKRADVKCEAFRSISSDNVSDCEIKPTDWDGEASESHYTAHEDVIESKE